MRSVFLSSLLFGLAQDVLDALERDRDRGKVLRAAHLSHRFGARNRIDHVVAAGSEHGIHHVIGEAAHVAQIELQALVA